MTDAAQIKRLSTAHANLLSAAGFLRPSSLPHMPPNPIPLAKVLDVLSEDALFTWMTELSAMTITVSPSAGCWRDLERAADSLGLHEHQEQFRAAFLKAVQRPQVNVGQDTGL